MMILVCHGSDGHFADGDRRAVRRILDYAGYACALESEYVAIDCADGGALALRAPGLASPRAFHRMEVMPRVWTADALDIVFELMALGGFGLVSDLDAPQFIVTQPEQISYFPWLPDPPLLARTARDLGHSIHSH